MKEELEVKFYPINKDKIRVILQEVGASLVHEETLMRRVIYDKKLNPQINCTYARVRDEGDRVTASLKVNAKHGGEISDQKELQVNVDSFDNMVQLFDNLGLRKANYQENYRESWNIQQTEIVIDTWPALEPYIEIEADSEVELQKVAELLSLDWEERIIVSTDEIYATKYNISKDEALASISNITFQNIPDIFK